MIKIVSEMEVFCYHTNMIDIQPSDEFKKEVASMPQPEVIKPSLDIALPAIPALSPAAQEAKDVDLDKNKQKARRWRIESALINLFALYILGVSLLAVLPVVLAGAINTSIGFFILLLAGIPGLLGFLLFRRSDMARRVIIGFMILNIAVNFFPGAFNIFSVASSLGVALFLFSGPIQRHF